MDFNIYIGNKDKTTVYKLPVIPENLPELAKQIKNEEFETWWDGNYNFIEKPGLLEFTLESWLPGKGNDYNFLKSNVKGPEVIRLLENARDNAEPIQIVISGSDGLIYANDTFSIEAFKSKLNFECDYDYSLGVKKYRNPDTEISATSNNTVGWKQDSTGWWYVYDKDGNYYRDCWKEIDNEWYSFDFEGYARQSTWLQDNGYWYWLKDTCKMARNEWVQIEDKWYYFGDLGGMYSNCYTPDGYWVDSDGVWTGSDS